MAEDPRPMAASFGDAMRMIRGFMLSQALHVAAKLSLFDRLRDGPMSARDLATENGAHAVALHRLMRFLTTENVLHEDEDGRFRCGAIGELLRSDHPQSARAQAVMYGEPFFWRPWGDLYGTVMSGMPAFDRIYGQSFFEHLASHPEDAAVFNASMTGASRIDLIGILGGYDFSGFRRIIDVGGGHGGLLQGILQRHPEAHGVLCDLPDVVAGATALRQSEVAARCEFVAADMFDAVPAGGDAYILKRILHDWDDDVVVRILKNVRRAIAPDGKLLVMEAVVLPSNQPDPAKWMDVNMLALLPGRERTEEEFARLFDTTGFRLTRVVPAAGLSIVEGAPR